MSVKHASNLLDEHPLLVYKSLAKALGINKAIIFQELHFLLNATKTAKRKYNFVDDCWWVYNSYDEWREDYFPWLSKGAIKRMFIELEEAGLVLSMQGVKQKSDRKKWYSIDYATWEQFVTMMGTKSDHDTSEQNEPMDDNNLSQSKSTKSADEESEISTETSTEVSTEIKDNTTAIAVVPAPVSDSQPLENSDLEEKPEPSRPKNELFDAVAEHVFGIAPDQLILKEGGRVGPIAAWLSGKSDGIKRGSKKEVVGTISAPAKPEHVALFASYWKTTNPTANVPLDFVKFVEAWRKWASSQRRMQTQGGILGGEWEDDDEPTSEPELPTPESLLVVGKDGRSRKDAWETFCMLYEIEDPQHHKVYIQSARLVDWRDGKFVVVVKNEHARDYCQGILYRNIRRILTSVYSIGEPVELLFEFAAPDGAPGIPDMGKLEGDKWDEVNERMKRAKAAERERLARDFAAVGGIDRSYERRNQEGRVA